MTDRLKGKVAIVVGAGQTPGETIGNGRAIATLYAREGAHLFLVDRDEKSLRETAMQISAAGGTTEICLADARKETQCAAAVEQCIERYGRIDNLTNVVGIGNGDTSAQRMTEDVWDTMMDVNIKSVLFTCKYALAPMRKAQSGNIINLSSAAAVAAAGYVGYKVSKAGVNALTHALAMSNAKYGIRANVIMPGLLDTPMAIEGHAKARGVERKQLRDERDALVPLRKRMGTAWDTANAAVFLSSDEAQFITGVVLPVDGGQIAKIG